VVGAVGCAIVTDGSQPVTKARLCTSMAQVTQQRKFPMGKIA